MSVSPLQPDEERLRDEAEKSEINKAVQVVVGTGNARDVDLLKNVEFFGADKDALLSGTMQVADSGAEHIDIHNFF